MRTPRRWKARLLGTLTAFILILSPMAVYAATQTFADVPENDWAFADVEWLAAKGLTSGCGDGSIYCPDGNVTRREMAAFTHRQELYLGPRFAYAYSTNVAVPNDTNTLLASGYITVPTEGGFVSAIANVAFDAEEADQWGWVWLEGNNGGACDGTNFIAATAPYDTYGIVYDTATVVGGFAGLVGDKRVDVCAWGIGTATAWDTTLELTWIAAGADGGDFSYPVSPSSLDDGFEQRKEALRQRTTP